MCTILGSFGREYVLVMLFQHYGPTLGFLKIIHSWWIRMTPSPNLHIGRRPNPILIYFHAILKQLI